MRGGSLFSGAAESMHQGWRRYAFFAVVVCAFGPYLTAGVRAEQLAVYGGGLVLALSAKWTRTLLEPAVAIVILLMSVQIIFALIGAVGSASLEDVISQ